MSCPSGQCHPEDRPKHAEYCENGPCSTSEKTSPWLLTEWSQCSASCGTGTQTRLSACLSSQTGSNCSDFEKPETSRACSSDKECGGQWFTGPWTSCSDSCSGQAKRAREVFCIVRIRGEAHVTTDSTCPLGEKPQSEEQCGVNRCPPKWFLGEWGVCENCEVQKREVRCMDAYGRVVQGCGEVPLAKRQCSCKDREKYKPAQDEPVDRKYFYLFFFNKTFFPQDLVWIESGIVI